MSEPVPAKPPAWYWAVAILALAWSGFLIFSYVTVIRSPGMATPVLPSILFAVNALVGLAGAIGLLLRRRWALPAMLVSLVAALVQHGLFFLQAPIALMVWQAIAIPALVLVLGFLLALTARAASRRGWLR